ncbi:MAG TPA: efflux RND transporter periplasmic adaptor subunit [Verrucomicrobiae bacterium]|nr:efflux RND transporter periplasmic adaptor subunit [Verrucomicrobiae bacterium]
MTDKLKELQIDPEQKRRPQRSLWTIFLGVLLIAAIAVFYAWPREKDKHRMLDTGIKAPTNSIGSNSAALSPSEINNDLLLTVSGYIINRERIEISPRFLGVVKWIGVRKGDSVTNGQIVVLLDDAEYQARLHEAEGHLANARTAVAKAELDYQRTEALARTDIESKQREDDARLALQSARASLIEAEGAYTLAKTYVDWCTIRSPIDGVVLEKLVDPNELVVPQSFGGLRGPSTALIAVADPRDLQVEIDLNEADLSKISLHQKCQVTPEAYPDKHYEGVVAEIAPEADRAKGTLQIKVQILAPDEFLTPQLSARVEFRKHG